MTSRRATAAVAAAALALAAPPSALAQDVRPHPIGAVIATATNRLGSVSQLRELDDGRVMVNDEVSRRVLIFDASLKNPVVVLDSVSGKPNSYGGPRASIFAFRGDSTVFSNRTAAGYVVLDGAGKIVRDMAMSIDGRFPGTYWSPHHGIAYAAGVRTEPPAQNPPPGMPPVAVRQDHFQALVTTHPDTRAVDTLAQLYTGTVTAWGASSGAVIFVSDLFPTSDHWVVTSDGRIAIVRGREYRVEWINADGSHSQGTRLPYPRTRVSDAARVRILDSVNAVRKTLFDDNLAKWRRDSTDAVNGKTNCAPTLPSAAVSAATSVATAGAASAGGGGGGGPGRGGCRFVPTSAGDGSPGLTMYTPDGSFPRPKLQLAQSSNIPDFLPAVANARMTAMADRDNQLWIRTQTWNGEGLSFTAYDVIGPSGAIVDRVQIPVGKTLVGFGRGGIAYVAAHDAGSVVLEKRRVR